MNKKIGMKALIQMQAIGEQSEGSSPREQRGMAGASRINNILNLAIAKSMDPSSPKAATQQALQTFNGPNSSLSGQASDFLSLPFRT